MDSFKTFDIHFVGLKNGIHRFEYQIDETFFELFENSIITNGNFTVALELKKNDLLFELHFSFKGLSEFICERCLDNLNFDFDFEETFVIKQVSELPEEDFYDEIEYILMNETKINVAEPIYEFLTLSVPMIVQHDDIQDCNPEFIKKLNEFAANSNEEKTNPFWDKLKGLNN
jgi:uncharacterized protein